MVDCPTNLDYHHHILPGWRLKMENLAFIPSVLILLTMSVNLIIHRWRINLILLALQYLAVFILASLTAPLSLAIIKLIIGIVVSATLFITCLEKKAFEDEKVPLIKYIYRGLASLFVLTFSIAILNGFQAMLPIQIPEPILLGSIALIALGLLQLGMTNAPLQVLIGILSFLSGFELLYISLERSVMLEGLLAGVNLALALTGAYLLLKDEAEEVA